jgi:signal transduction histidine kinase
MSHKRLPLLLLGLAVAGGLPSLVVLGHGMVIFPLLLISIIFLFLKLATGVLPRLIARIGFSIRWKVLAAIGIMALLFFLVSLVNFGAMSYMHDELHQIQQLSSRSQMVRALDALEKTQHGLIFSMTPFLSFLAALVALGLGVAIAWSVIEPVRRMGEAMRRIASGDFSQPLKVENRDELGELANRINHASQELAKLQEATLAEERARALQERIVQVSLAQEEERRRISRELHDGLGPSLAALGNRIRACQHLVHTNPQQAEAELEEIAKGLRGHVQEVRHLIHNLRPLALDQLGLIEAVKQQVEHFSQETGIQTSFNVSSSIVLNPFGEVTVFRVIQECLSNVRKHAGASQVAVELRGVNSGLELRVQDNGRGFNPSNIDPSISLPSAGLGQAHGKGEPRGVSSGLGLVSMKERAELLGGNLSVQSSPGQGCQIILYVPIKEIQIGAHSSPVSG